MIAAGKRHWLQSCSTRCPKELQALLYKQSRCRTHCSISECQAGLTSESPVIRQNQAAGCNTGRSAGHAGTIRKCKPSCTNMSGETGSLWISEWHTQCPWLQECNRCCTCRSAGRHRHGHSMQTGRTARYRPEKQNYTWPHIMASSGSA